MLSEEKPSNLEVSTLDLKTVIHSVPLTFAPPLTEAVPHDKLKRIPRQPREGKFVNAQAHGQYPVVLTPQPFDEML